MSPIQVESIPASNTYELDVYGKRGLCLERGEGSWVWDDSGRRYLDCVAGHGSVNLGHSHPEIIARLVQQSRRLMSCPGSFFNREKMTYLERLIRLAPQGLHRGFLSNSGTESVEAALKFARIATGRSRIIAAKRGFHGRTYGSLSATGTPKYQKGCGPLVPDFQHIPFNDGDALQAIMDGNVAAVILEVIQGEGGVFVATPAYLKQARNLCDQHGALLIIDEVQTGFGRSGKLFACEHFELQPDILCLAKSIANGLPMGATLVNPKVQVNRGQHGSTFGGNPLACAVANKVLDLLTQERVPQQAAETGRQLEHSLRAANLPKVREIRGKGLMLGLELRTRVQPILGQLMEQGVLALAAGSTILRLLPPLTIHDGEVDFLMETLKKVLA